MSVFRVALLQMASCGTDQRANLAKGEEFCRRAAQLGADIALFPEMWNIGYSFYDREKEGSLEEWRARAIGRDSTFVNHFRALARELDMAIALTYLEEWPSMPRNSVSIIDRHGEIILTYAKVHTCDFDVECALTPGDDFYVCELDTAGGPVKLGVMICYDREFPESARVLMLKGAEIILTPNACTLEDLRISQFKTRAYENMVGMAMSNYAAPQQNGHSIAFDAVAYEQIDGDPSDLLIVEAGPAEGIYMAPFDLERLRAYRLRETWGNSYRKPRTYGPICAPDVTDPFIRPDSRR
jgi:predicted amidohydrolase